MSNLDKFIIWERPCLPALVYIAAEAVMLPHIKNFGRPWAKTYGFFSKGMVRFVWNKREFVGNALYITKKFLKKSYLKVQLKKYSQLSRRLRREFNSLDNIKLKDLNNREFLFICLKFHKVFLEWWGFAQVAEMVGAGCEALLLKKRILSQREMSIITTPTKKSYTLKEEEDLLQIAKLYLKGVNVTKALKKHEQEYFWLQNNYEKINYLDSQYFFKLVKKQASQLKNTSAINSIISLNIHRLRQYKIVKKHLQQEMSFTQYEKQLVHLMDFFADFQDKRKAVSLQAHHYEDMFIREVARRTRLSYTRAMFLILPEYSDVLNGAFNLSRLNHRFRHFSIILDERGLRTLEGSSSQQEENKLLGAEAGDQINEFEGARAMGGKVTGHVRLLLNPRDSISMKHGEILVTTMTSPDFLPAVKKARAIITDEGGVTCHAAIISRELGVPCVIGTKVATRILHDGDLVEVNADHGIIKLLKRS